MIPNSPPPQALLSRIRWGFAYLIVAHCLCLMGLRASSAATDDIKIDRLFGPEIPTGRYKHPACFDVLRNGDLYLVYYGGDGEYAESTAVFGSRFRKGEKTWSKPLKIASHPLGSLGNGVVWQAPDGLVWLFFVVRPGATWSSSRISAKVSSDGAHSWSDSFPISFEEGTMVRSHPVALNDGDFLLPVYLETGKNTEFTAATTCSFFLRFNPKTKTWKESNRIHSRLGNLQPSAVQLDDQNLIALCRRGGDYNARNDAYIVRTESHDGGLTWSEGRDSEFPNPHAAIDLIRLKNGHLLLVYNDSMNDRTPLTAALSTDNGKTFPHRRNLIGGPGDFGYPTAIQTPDGMLHVLFTSDERTVIRHATFEERALLKGSDQKPFANP